MCGILTSCLYYRMRREQNKCQSPKGTSGYRRGGGVEETEESPALGGDEEECTRDGMKPSPKCPLDGGPLRVVPKGLISLRARTQRQRQLH